ncbi:uncharacterized protein LOC131955779 [Physella acuta]|uniref:uncharacterized protein LOC131955779 n=1 Tax=Physella acuta TaxID=109671 RepID=UPI0027DC116B|nr:uncharacterized protein LOC131955779 [Physella acuta]
MVLKKSNSRLNSGATQRVSRGGVIFAEPITMTMENVIAFTVPPIQPKNEKLEENVSKCLEKIWNYIQWEGPGLPRIQISNYNSAVFYTLNKDKRWLLPARIDTMMSDIDFLQKIPEYFNLRMVKRKDIPNRSYRKPHLSETKDAFKILAQRAQEGVGNQEKKSRKRLTYHGRGVQRPHEYQRKPHKERNRVHTPFPDNVKAELDIGVVLPYHVDARSAYNYNYDLRYGGYGNLRHNPKSFFKTKSYVNGQKECFKGFTKADMKEDTIETLMELHGECEEYMDYCDTDCCHSLHVYSKGCNKDLAQEVYLCDLIVDNKKKTKRQRKRKEKIDVQMFYKDWCNQQSDKVFTEKNWRSEHNLKQSSRHNLQDDQLNHSFEIISSEEAAYDLDVEQPNKSHSLVDEFNSGNVQFDLSFVNVDLVEETLFSCENELDQQQLSESGVVDVCLGNSYPPCFVVKFSGENDETKEWYLVGKKSGHPNSSWLISIQCQDNLEINAKCRQRISEQLGCRLTFQNLIYLVSALKYDVFGEHSCLTTNKKLGHATSSNFIWQLLPQTRTISTHTTTDAVSLLQQQLEYKGDPEQLFLTSLIKTKAEVIQTSDCTTCCLPYTPDNPALMLSCGHAFCVSCWRTHLFYNNRHGTSYLPCMITNCSCQMDLVTLKSILPFSVVTKWSNQARDNLIDSNPKCNWCPEKDCQKFAISTSFPLKTQFGFPVSCGCSHNWCGNCQKTPHWPTSCDQMSAYNKLLEKTGAQLKFGQAVFRIKLKHCPQCENPIEKNGGCPSMVCRACSFNFCWQCLRDTQTHNIFACKDSSESYKTHSLANDLVSDLPIKYFTTCLELHKFSSHIKLLEKWLQNILQMKAVTVKFPTSVLCVSDNKSMLDLTKSLAEESFYFLEHASTFMEMFYVLLSFAAVDKRKFCKITAVSLHKMSRLEFINKRLENYVMGKTLPQISKSVRSIEILLKAGENAISELVQLAPLLQNISKDVKAETIGELEPLKYLRYK